MKKSRLRRGIRFVRKETGMPFVLACQLCKVLQRYEGPTWEACEKIHTFPGVTIQYKEYNNPSDPSDWTWEVLSFTFAERCVDAHDLCSILRYSVGIPNTPKKKAQGNEIHR